MKREKYFKTTMGKKAIRQMLSSTLEKPGYKNCKQTRLEIIHKEVS